MVPTVEVEELPPEPTRERSVILAELRELTLPHVRPEWQQWCLDRLPKMGQLDLF